MGRERRAQITAGKMAGRSEAKEKETVEKKVSEEEEEIVCVVHCGKTNGRDFTERNRCELEVGHTGKCRFKDYKARHFPPESRTSEENDQMKHYYYARHYGHSKHMKDIFMGFDFSNPRKPDVTAGATIEFTKSKTYRVTNLRVTIDE